MKQPESSKQDVGNVVLRQANAVLDNVRDLSSSDSALGITCSGGRSRAIETARAAIAEAYQMFVNVYSREPRSPNELFEVAARSLRIPDGVAQSYSSDERASAASMLDYIVDVRGPRGELDLERTVPRRV